ncbi:MAG TPA: hypothetical protein VF084_12050 [Nitrososphaeraceae archaeon]
MRAIKNNELYVLDEGSYFSKPGPRTITGIDIFGKNYFAKFYHITIPENVYQYRQVNAKDY